MEKLSNNIKSKQFGRSVYDFFVKYRYIILIGFFTDILVNAVDVFTVKFGIDSETYALENSPQIYFDSQRYGSWLLYYLFPFARYHIISQIIGIFALTLAALLTVSRHNISNNAKLLFVLLFVTYPNFAFLQYFYFQSAYNFIGLLFVVVAYRLIEKNNIPAYMISVILLFVGISSYQANIAVFLTVMMINIILDFICVKDFKSSVTKIAVSTAFMIITVIIYYVLIIYTHQKIGSYHSDFIGYNHGIIKGLGSVFTNIWHVLSSNGFQGGHTANLIITIIIMVYLLYFIKQYKSYKENLQFIFLILLFLLAIFSLNIVLVSALPIRAKLATAFYPAFILLLIFIMNRHKAIRQITVLLTMFIICYHTTYIVRYQTSYYMTYKKDEVTANDIISKIYDRYPEIYNMSGYKIAFYGSLQVNNHPLIQAKDVFNASFFSWDGGNPVRMLAFLKLSGFPMEVQLENITSDMQKAVDNLPSYPNKNCVGLYEDTVIVKLR